MWLSVFCIATLLVAPGALVLVLCLLNFSGRQTPRLQFSLSMVEPPQVAITASTSAQVWPTSSAFAAKVVPETQFTTTAAVSATYTAVVGNLATTTTAGTAGAILKTCSLRPCMLHAPQAPRLFVRQCTDGAGHTMKNILDGIAVAEKTGMNFGGVVVEGVEHLKQQGIDFLRIADGFFGANASGQLFNFNPPQFSSVLQSVPELEQARSGFAPFQNIYLPEVVGGGGDPNTYYTAELRKSLRLPLESRPLRFAPSRVSVGVYVRRGDLNRSDWRAYPDSYYFGLVERIWKFFPQADIHVWSSTKPGWKVADFEGYRSRGMSVHLDGDENDFVDIWAHLSRADIFIMAQGSFSFIPAVLNTNCVIYRQPVDRVLKNWIGNDWGKRSHRSEFEGCMDRAAHSASSAMLATKVASRTCNLAVCTFHGLNAPRLYVSQHSDGAGHSMKNILDGISVASKNHMNFGGVYAPFIKSEQGLIFARLLDGFFGKNAARELSFPSKPQVDATFESVHDLELARKGFKDLADIYLPSVDGSRQNQDPNAYYTEELRRLLRRPMESRPLQFALGRLAVGLHVRRGDLHLHDKRAYPDSYYFEIVKRIQNTTPKVDVHVWSSTSKVWTSAGFDGYRSRGMHVHLDGDEEEIIDTWAHLSRANIFIMAQSHFSFVPAVLNTNCVIYLPPRDHILNNWARHDKFGPMQESEFNKCMADTGWKQT